MKPISQIKFLAENYSVLHGLRGSVVGLCLLLVSVWANNQHGPAKNFAPLAIIVVGSFLLFIAIDQYYKRVWGGIKPSHSHLRLQWAGGLISGILAVTAFWMDATINMPVSFFGLLFAIVLFLDKPAIAIPLNRFTAIKFFSAMIMVLAGISPLFIGTNEWNSFGIKSTILGVTMLAGALGIAQGALWHVFLAGSLPASGNNDE